MTDPKRWLDEDRALLGALTRAGAAERPAASAKHRARAAVLLATAGSAASAVATKAAAATVATTSAPPVSLAASGSLASGTAATTGAVGTAKAIATGAVGLTTKFGVSAVVLGVAAKWTGVGAIAAAVGFGGYRMAASGGDLMRLTAPTDALAPSATVATQQISNVPVVATSLDVRAAGSQQEPTPTAARSRARIDVNEQATAQQRSSTRDAQIAHEPRALPTTPAHNPELALVDRAWAALRAGKSDEALRLIDGYSWTASERQFETEALLIRLEALSQSGRTEAARALANKILATHHGGRLADRARSVSHVNPTSERKPASP